MLFLSVKLRKKIEITYFFDGKMFFEAAQKGSILLSAIRILVNLLNDF